MWISRGCRIILLAAIGVDSAVAQSDAAKQARLELFAARYQHAADLYRQAIEHDASGDAYYGMVRALLKAHHNKEAYAAGEEALTRAAQTPGAETAAGLSLYRQGELSSAENHFRTAIKLDPKYSGALAGLADIYSALSQDKGARDLLRQAYEASPDDPKLMLAHANSLKGADHIAALERVLDATDPETEDARSLRAHIAADRALNGRKARRLISPYEPARLKLVRIGDASRVRGYGLDVKFNGRYEGRLLLDTGASGISLSPKAAQKAGFEMLGDTSTEAKGIGDQKPNESRRYLASEVRIGSVVFGEHPVSVFRSAKDSDIDGLIGADVFQRFVVAIDFPHQQIDLQPYSSLPPDDPEDATTPPAGFHRLIRSGDHLMIATSVNNHPAKWFLIDSGSSQNLIDTASAREFTGVHRDDRTGVRGLQGKVDGVSRADKITLVFGGFRQDNSDLIAISLEKPSDSIGIALMGVLGMPVLWQLRMTIDYRAGAVRFEKVR
jgi:Flp pilus assembly protein TadD/predicted aspartyl protease